MPQKPHVPTEVTRAEVLALAGFGTKHEDIATYLGIAVPTLTKYYKEELATGAIKANSTVAKTLYKLAINGDAKSCMFWLKTRAGWRETDGQYRDDGSAIRELANAIRSVANGRPETDESETASGD